MTKETLTHWKRRALKAEQEVQLLRERTERDMDVYRELASELADYRVRFDEIKRLIEGDAP